MSLLRILTLLLLAAITATAFRTSTHGRLSSKSLKHQEKNSGVSPDELVSNDSNRLVFVDALEEAGPDLVDVTKLLENDKFKNSGYRCCCDKFKQTSWSYMDKWRGINDDRAGYCKVVEEPSCGPVKVAETTQKAHNYADTGGKCDILASDALDFYKMFGSPLDYCPATRMGEFIHGNHVFIIVPKGHLHQEVSYTCPEDSKPKGKAKCVWKAAKFGEYENVGCEGEAQGGVAADPLVNNVATQLENAEAQQRVESLEEQLEKMRRELQNLRNGQVAPEVPTDTNTNTEPLTKADTETDPPLTETDKEPSPPVVVTDPVVVTTTDKEPTPPSAVISGPDPPAVSNADGSEVVPSARPRGRGRPPPPPGSRPQGPPRPAGPPLPSTDETPSGPPSGRGRPPPPPGARGRPPPPPGSRPGGPPRPTGPGTGPPRQGPPRGPGTGAPRPGGPRAAAAPLKAGEKFLNGPFKTVLTGADVFLRDKEALDISPIRDLFDVQYVKKQSSEVSAEASSPKSPREKKPATKLQEYKLATLKMREISISALLGKVKKAMGAVNMKEFIDKLASNDAVDAVNTIMQDRDLTDNWNALLQEVTEDDEEMAVNDEILMGKAPLDKEMYKGITATAQFVADVGSRRKKLTDLTGCLLFAHEANGILGGVDVGDKPAFYAKGDGSAGKLVATLDESISNFLVQSFEGMPDPAKPEGKDLKSLYSKFERTLSSASANIPEHKDSILVPMLFVSNVLNNNRKELRIRAQLMNNEPSGVWSPFVLDVFLAFAKSNPKGYKDSYLNQIQDSCNNLAGFQVLAPNEGAGVQWYTLDTQIKTQLGQCKTRVPAIAPKLEEIETSVIEISGKLKEVIDVSIEASGRIMAQFAKKDVENDLFEQVKQIAKLKLAQEIAPEAFENNELLNDENLRKVIVKFCANVKEHVPLMDKFKKIGSETEES